MTETGTVNEPPDLGESTDTQRVIQSFLDAVQGLETEGRTPAKLTELISTITGTTHCLLLKYDAVNATLVYEASFPKPIGAPPNISVNVYNADDGSIVARLNTGEIVLSTSSPDDERLESVTAFTDSQNMALLPLQRGDTLLALLILYNQPDRALSEATKRTLAGLRPALTTIVDMVLEASRLRNRVDEIERDAEIFSRIDAELNDTIDLSYVFTMMKDWALRFTNADAAALALYDQESDALRIMSQYGFKEGTFDVDAELPQEQGGIILRVARSGQPEIVPDVVADSDYYALADSMTTQMSVPIKREEKVIGVLTLLSRKFNGFTDYHLDFAKRLSNRAGVAVDNARLFTATKRERERLSYILRNIADIVILVDVEHRVEMLNSSALLALQLPTDRSHIGQSFNSVVTHSQLQTAYHDAIESDDSVTTEVDLPNGRTYHVSIEHHVGIGRIIVMQDITYFKETDRLKTELVATVSHDLKQPLSVMRGYLDLLSMVNEFDEKSLKYISNLNYAFQSMRQLIDDLLDIARIEAGLSLDLEDVSIADILNHAVRSSQQQADHKDITLEIELPTSIPAVSGDPKRLEQVFTNLVTNAIKYTPPGGIVKVYMEVRQDAVRVYVKDNGMGIGAEDQAKIFERFYRVRRPETDSIEGTGLGLAIVKSLIEAHEGKIDLKSVLGEGSTFRVTLPIH